MFIILTTSFAVGKLSITLSEAWNRIERSFLHSTKTCGHTEPSFSSNTTSAVHLLHAIVYMNSIESGFSNNVISHVSRMVRKKKSLPIEAMHAKNWKGKVKTLCDRNRGHSHCPGQLEYVHQ